MQEYRCYVNQKLLFKAEGVGQVEILNLSNRILNYAGPSRASQDVGPKGQEFAKYGIECRCTKCTRLLFRAISIDLKVETKCKHCKEISTYDIAKIEKQRIATLSTKQLENYNQHKMKLMGL